MPPSSHIQANQFPRLPTTSRHLCTTPLLHYLCTTPPLHYLCTTSPQGAALEKEIAGLKQQAADYKQEQKSELKTKLSEAERQELRGLSDKEKALQVRPHIAPYISPS